MYTGCYSKCRPKCIVGPRGPQGPQGPRGCPGRKGDTGQRGSQGPMGPTGCTGFTGCTGPINCGVVCREIFNGITVAISSDKTNIVGTDGELCLALDHSDLYEWNGSTWEQLNPQPDRPYLYRDTCTCQLYEVVELGEHAQHVDCCKYPLIIDRNNCVVYECIDGCLVKKCEITKEGPTGPSGSTGPTGPPGEDGITPGPGPPGPTGQTGDKGDKGDTGCRGPKGEKGDDGDTGPKGDRGDRGSKGDRGPQGDRGCRGPKGDTGPPGETPLNNNAFLSFSFNGECPVEYITIVRTSQQQETSVLRFCWDGDSTGYTIDSFTICFDVVESQMVTFQLRTANNTIIKQASSNVSSNNKEGQCLVSSNVNSVPTSQTVMKFVVQPGINGGVVYVFSLILKLTPIT